jgi:hypothetical protein
MQTKKLWLTQASAAAVLVVAASACANLIGLSDYEVDESSTSAGTGGGGTGGTAGSGTGGGGTGGGGTGGTAAGSAGSGGCIPTADPRQCASNGQCCDFASDQARCVNFPDRGAFCSSRCTMNSECQSNCCVELDSGNSACAFPEFCGTGGSSGTGGTGGSGGAGATGGIGSPCTGSGTCGSGTNAGTCNGRWCTKACTRSTDCPGNTWCIRNNAGTNTCFLGCTTSTNCAALSGTTCQSATTIDSLPMNVCSLPPSGT